MWNPLSIAGSWRIDPDNRQDRGCSEVKSYKLPPEEIENLIKSSAMSAKKGNKPFTESVLQIKRTKMEAEEFMSKISKEQLTMECQKLGCNMDAYKDIAKRYGFTNWHSVECAVSKQGIKKLLAAGNAQEDKTDNADAKTFERSVTYTNNNQQEESVFVDEFEVLDKIKAIVVGNKEHLKGALEENIALKLRLAKIKTMLEEVLYEL